MVHELARTRPSGWLKSHVGFARHCRSDQPRRRPANSSYRDALLTVAEPYALWAIEADPAELRAAFPIESATVVVEPDITFYRERKLRLLNALHTATTPLALLAGVRIVRDASAHPLLGPFQKRLLFEEIIPAISRWMRARSRTRYSSGSPIQARPSRHRDEPGGKFRIRVVPLIVRRPDSGGTHARAAATRRSCGHPRGVGDAACIRSSSRPQRVGWTSRHRTASRPSGVHDVPLVRSHRPTPSHIRQFPACRVW
jgi:hypothetical protein